MPKLNWIPDEDLFATVAAIIKIAKATKLTAPNTLGKNVIDPFSAIFEITGFGMSYDAWLLSEEARQAQKTFQNFIGVFHQVILGSCAGWENVKTGNIIDLHNKEHRVIAELKNKFNTNTGAKLTDQYKSLESLVMNKTSIYKNYTVYYVEIIPMQPSRYDHPFAPSGKKKGTQYAENPLIRQIDGASFYELVTGEKDALAKLYTALPDVIAEITAVSISNRDKLSQLFEAAYGQPKP